MAEFNPDAFLAKYGAQQPEPPKAVSSSKGFDPDAFLAKYGEKKEIPEGRPTSLSDVEWMKGGAPSSKGLLRGAVKALPIAGGMAGGAIGLASPIPGGAAIGGGLGAAGGEALKQAIEQQAGLEEAQPTGQNIAEIGKAGITGLASEMGGQVLTKAIGAAPGLLKRFADIPAKGAEKIKAAAERLGIEPTRGVLSGSEDIKALESSLSQQPTIAGGKVAEKVRAGKAGMEAAAEKTVAERASASPFELGESIKDAVTSKIGEKLAPLKMNYDELAETYQNVALNPKSMKKYAEGLRKSDIGEFPQTDTGAIVHRYADMMESAKSASSLRTLESEAGRALNAAQRAGNYNEVNAYGQVLKTLKRAQQSNIIRSAVEASGKKEGQNVSAEVITQLKDTNKGYRALMQEAQTIAEAAGVRAKSPMQFLDAIEGVSSEQLAQRMFNMNKFKQLSDIKQSLPEQFESLRKAKLDEIANKSVIKGNIDPAKLVKNIKALPKEARELLFGKDNLQRIDDMETIINAAPQMIGPSGTPKGMAWMNLFKPTHVMDELGSGLQYMLYKKADKIKGLIEAGENMPKPAGLGAGVGLLKER